ncbi:protein DEK [Pseudophryne corroboree]|uniref:protein DEK n=1 Tax=Pseudophryne corroboree TaxID=495146 RepID=UPI003081CB95
MKKKSADDTLNKEEESDTVEQPTEDQDIEEDVDGSEGEKNEAVEENEEEEEDDDEDEDDDDKKEKSLIVEGKREKKKVERLTLEMTMVKKEPVLSEGKGQKLCDIERIQYFLKKKKCEELRLLHRLLFNRLGTVNLLKKTIGQFNGFAFEKGSDQYKKKEELLKKARKDDLKKICAVLDLEKCGTNIELISKILTFLMEPKSTGKPLPKSKSKSPKGGKKERSSSGSARKSKTVKSNVILPDESSSEDEIKDKESSDGEKESEEEKEEKPPKKTPKKERAKPKVTPKSKKATKSANVKKADSSTTNTKTASNSKKEKPAQSESESDDSSDDEPLIKKVHKPPTDDELRETVKKLLTDANLEEVTMKEICRKVNEHYPSYDLVSRKKFIKATVKELIS